MIAQTLLVCLVIAAHDGPDPILSYALRQDDVRGQTLRSVLGPEARLARTLDFVPTEEGGGAELCADDLILIAEDHTSVRELLPTREMTVSAWVSVTTPRRWGGIVSVIQDNGEAERGWVLGYDTEHFTFGLATTGADDGDGHMTYLTGKTRYREGRLYHVVATFDGQTTRLFVNGRLDAESRAQAGNILYPDHAPVVLGAYKDADEFYPHEGRLMDVRVYDLAAGASWVSDQFGHHADRASLVRLAPQRPVSESLGWQVPPILQYATGHSIRVVFETTRPVTGRVDFGESEKFARAIAIDEPVMLGEVVLDGLNPDEPYFYKVVVTDDRGRELTTDVLTFQTAAPRGTPVAFAVIGDTQDNPAVAGTLAAHIWAQRPGFVLHAGDLTGTGSRKGDWTEEFFPSMGPLMSRVTLYPVLGNHEENARHYYKYFSLPQPEYYYSFSQGDVDFFMIDSNREVSPGSEQYVWLDQALGSSDATWKVAVHHHPPYSSDEDDYGDTWKGRSTRGDLRIRSLSELYEAHGVDLVLNGHIHSYERTWPIVGGKAVTDGGVIYAITGGGGGGLETPGPTRANFSNTVYRGHHYCMVRVNGPTLEFFAYDLEGRLFDHMKIEKK
ncbi:MAG: metallophosphoesterase [Phycisphaerales bacterium]|nr:metallophosphoesterase [Phycisphaerales bacterium]